MEDDTQQYAHDGTVDYAEMAGLGETEYDQFSAHEGGDVQISHEAGAVHLGTEHADGSYSQEDISLDPDSALQYADTEWEADHSVSQHGVFTDHTVDTHSAHGQVDESEEYHFSGAEAGDEISHESHELHGAGGAAYGAYEADELEGL